MDRWIIGATGAEEGTGEPTHHIFELNQKTGVYSTVLQTFTLSYALLVLEALCWQEDLQRGLIVDPGEGKVAKAKPVKKQPAKAKATVRRRS